MFARMRFVTAVLGIIFLGFAVATAASAHDIIVPLRGNFAEQFFYTMVCYRARSSQIK